MSVLIHEIQIRRVKALQQINQILKVKYLNKNKTKVAITGKNVKLVVLKEKYVHEGKDEIKRLKQRRIFYIAPAREIKWIGKDKK